MQDQSLGSMVQAVLGASKPLRFKACSGEVEAALKPDRMKSVVHLVPDLLQAGLPILIYEGASLSRLVSAFLALIILLRSCALHRLTVPACMLLYAGRVRWRSP